MTQNLITINKLIDIIIQKLQKKFIMSDFIFDIKQGDKIFDIGSCTGDMTILYSKLVGDYGHVYSIEPESMINSQRVKSLTKDMKNVTVYECAIGNKNSPTTLYLSEDPSHNTCKSDFNWSKSHNKERGSMKVKMYTLDKFVSSYKINQINHIFMNVEGSEVDIIKGGLNTLKEFHPNIYIAPHELNDKLTLNECKSLLESIGYNTFTFKSLLYAYINEINIQSKNLCKSCNNNITNIEDTKFNGLCYLCYYEMIKDWFNDIFR